MTMQPDPNVPEAEGLQFDHAEFDNAGSAVAVMCAACRQPIVDQYYEINGATLCTPCRERIEAQLRGGSGFFRLVKATFFGSGAALAGAAIYFALLYFLHIQVGLVSILCGYIIGKSVRKGSEGRGGWIYQILAIVLTYLAIGLAYASFSLATGELASEVDKMPVDPQAGPMDPMARSIVIAVVYFFTIFASPILVSTTDVISAILILIALWEAWKFTKKAQLVVTGPYRVGDGTTDGAVEYA